jgi:hypothetical protein
LDDDCSEVVLCRWMFWWRSAQKEGHFIPEKCVADDREKMTGLRNKSHPPRPEKLLVFRVALSVRSLRMGPLDLRVEGASKDGREGGNTSILGIKRRQSLALDRRRKFAPATPISVQTGISFRGKTSARNLSEMCLENWSGAL